MTMRRWATLLFFLPWAAEAYITPAEPTATMGAFSILVVILALALVMVIAYPIRLLVLRQRNKKP